MMRMTVSRLCVMALLMIGLTGCSQSSVKLAPVQGRVTAESEPFAEGLVRFIPKPGSNLNSREATTDSDGNYRIIFFPGQPGLQPGDYTVMFSMYKMPDGSPPPDQSDEQDPKHPTALGAVQYVAPEFEFGKASECEVTVTEEGGAFDFELPELKPQSTGRTVSRK